MACLVPVLFSMLHLRVFICCTFSFVFAPPLFSRPGRSQGLLCKHPCYLLTHYLIYWLTDPLVPTTLRCRHAQWARDRSSSYKTDYIIVTAILLKGWILPVGGASAGEGLHLQPAQQVCLYLLHLKFCTYCTSSFVFEAPSVLDLLLLQFFISCISNFMLAAPPVLYLLHLQFCMC